MLLPESSTTFSYDFHPRFFPDVPPDFTRYEFPSHRWHVCSSLYVLKISQRPNPCDFPDISGTGFFFWFLPSPQHLHVIFPHDFPMFFPSELLPMGIFQNGSRPRHGITSELPQSPMAWEHCAGWKSMGKPWKIPWQNGEMDGKSRGKIHDGWDVWKGISIGFWRFHRRCSKPNWDVMNQLRIMGNDGKCYGMRNLWEPTLVGLLY